MRTVSGDEIEQMDCSVPPAKISNGMREPANTRKKISFAGITF